MKFFAQARKSGNSLAITIDRNVVKLNNIEEGMIVHVDIISVEKED